MKLAIVGILPVNLNKLSKLPYCTSKDKSYPIHVVQVKKGSAASSVLSLNRRRAVIRESISAQGYTSSVRTGTRQEERTSKLQLKLHFPSFQRLSQDWYKPAECGASSLSSGWRHPKCRWRDGRKPLALVRTSFLLDMKTRAVLYLRLSEHRE